MASGSPGSPEHCQHGWVARSRLGVALLVPLPLAHEVNGLRRALGDPTLERVPPHLTLVPPVNVRDEDIGRALAVLRAAAASAPPSLSLGLGAPASFLPHSPVLYLQVSGDLDTLELLRRRTLSPPLARPLSWPFVPHVTVADEASPQRIAQGVLALGDYQATLTVDRVHLLRETRHREGRRWEPFADAAFGPPAVIGRGGLALELTRSQLLDPEAVALLDAGGVLPLPCPPSVAAPADGDPAPVVITGRRHGAIVGVAAAWLGPDGGEVAVFVDAGTRRQGIGSHLLAAVEAAVGEAGWGSSRLLAIGPPGFYGARSAYARASPPSGDPGEAGGPAGGAYSKRIDE